MGHVSCPEGDVLAVPSVEGRNHIRLGSMPCPIYSAVCLEQAGRMRLGQVWLCQLVCSGRHGTKVASRILRIFLLLLICWWVSQGAVFM